MSSYTQNTVRNVGIGLAIIQHRAQEETAITLNDIPCGIISIWKCNMDISKSAEKTYEEAKKMCERLQELTAKMLGDICEKNVAQSESR